MASPGQQLVEMQFTSGINEAIRSEVLDPSQGWPKLENLRVDARAAVRKRYGFTALSRLQTDGVTNVSAGYKAFTSGTTPCVIDGSGVYSYASAAGEWLNTGRLPEVGYTTRAVTVPSSAPYVTDVEVAGNYVCVLTQGAAGALTYVYGTVMDATSGAVVGGSTSAIVSSATTNNSVVGSYGSRYFIAFVSNSAGTIVAYKFDTQAPSSGWSSLATVEAAWTGTTLQIAVCSLADRVAIAYTMNAGTDRVSVKTYNAAGVLETTTVNTSSTLPTAIDLAGSNADTLWVAWNEGTACKLKGLTGNSLATVKATAATIITAGSTIRMYRIVPTTTGNGRLIVHRDGTGSDISDHVGFTTSAGAAAKNGTTSTVPNFSVSGRPFYYGGRTYVMGWAAGVANGGVSNGSQALCFLVDFTDEQSWVRPVANLFPGRSSNTVIDSFGINLIPWPWTKVCQTATTTKWLFGTNVLQSQVAVAAELVTLDFGDSLRWKPVSHGGSTFLPGAVTSYFDGVKVQEVGFLMRPTKPTTSTAGTGVSLTNGRRYVAVYEAVDASGNWVVSGISDPSASTGAVVNKTISVVTVPISVSYRAADVGTRIAFYGTLDSNSGSPPYYRLDTVANDLTSTTVTYSDTTTDATLSNRPMLYAPNLPSTVGESLDRRAPPGLMHLISYNGFLVGAAGSNLYHSGQSVDGEAAWFSPIFQQPIPGNGDITGLQTQDGVLYVFKRDAIFTVTGDPPSDNGTQGGLGAPRKLTANTGCIDARSLVSTEMGIFFQSSRGIELLDRSTSVQWIGEKVRATTAAYPVITAATLDFVQGLVRFELAATETANQVSGNGCSLVYDLALNVWISKDRRKNSSGTADTPAQSACMAYVSGSWRYCWLGTNGAVYYEDTSTYLDPASAWVTMLAESASVKVGGVQGMQHANRALLLAKWTTGHDLNAEFAYDYATTYGTLRTWTAAELASLTAAIPNQQLEMVTDDNAEGQAVRVKMYDATPTSGSVGTGAGATWIALSVEVVPQAGAYKLPDASR